MITFLDFGPRADGTAILTRLQIAQRHLQDGKGHMPPELRNTPKSDEAARRRTMNFRTDISFS